MKSFLVLLCWLWTSLGAAAAEPAAKVPASKWLDGVDGLEEALALQKLTQANMFLYFAFYGEKSQEGLCKWFEKRGLAQQNVTKFLRDYIKVKITLPVKKKEEAVLERYRVSKCPVVLIIPPDGHAKRCKVFEWPSGKPQLLDPFQLVGLFASNTPPAAVAAPPAPAP